MKASVRVPVTTASVSRSAVSRRADRRTWGKPSSESRSGGSHRANVIAPRGDVSSVIAVTGAPTRRDAASAGSPEVADARMKLGFPP
jgi:hypothetical protein